MFNDFVITINRVSVMTQNAMIACAKAHRSGYMASLNAMYNDACNRIDIVLEEASSSKALMHEELNALRIAVGLAKSNMATAGMTEFYKARR